MILFPTPAFEIPPMSGFYVGGDTGYDHLAMVWYQHMHSEAAVRMAHAWNETKGGGFIVHVAENPEQTQVGRVAIVASDALVGSIPAHSIGFIQNDCKIKEDIVMHPIAIHAHTHAQGVSIKVWIDGKNSDITPLIDVRSSSLLDVDIRIDEHIIVTTGDTISIRCEYNNTFEETTIIG
jgi:hypothetical protein